MRKAKDSRRLRHGWWPLLVAAVWTSVIVVDNARSVPQPLAIWSPIVMMIIIITTSALLRTRILVSWMDSLEAGRLRTFSNAIWVYSSVFIVGAAITTSLLYSDSRDPVTFIVLAPALLGVFVACAHVAIFLRSRIQ